MQHAEASYLQGPQLSQHNMAVIEVEHKEDYFYPVYLQQHTLHEFIVIFNVDITLWFKESIINCTCKA